MTVPKALRAIQFVLPEWMFIYSGASLGSVAIRVNISFQPDEEQKGAHLLYGQAPGWLTSSRLEKPLPQLSWHVRVTRASIVPKHKLWLIQRTYTIHSHAYLARSSSLFSFCLGFLYTSLRQRLTRGTAKRIVCLFFFRIFTVKCQKPGHSVELSLGYPSAIGPLLFQPQREVAIWDRSWP